MDIDIDCLRSAQLENVERLAMALGLRLPEKVRQSERTYARELYRHVLRGLREDRARQERARFSPRRFWS